MADENLVTVSSNEGPKINVEITSYKNIVDLNFLQSIESVISAHNANNDAHRYLREQIARKANTSDMATALASKVSAEEGKSLSTNDLTNELKASYDDTQSKAHTHLNKASLDNLSGTNTGDQDLSGLATKTLGNITLASALNNLGFAGQLLGTNGYYKFPSGLIIQWGYTDASVTTTQQTVTFPIAFPNACLNVLTQVYYASGASVSGGSLTVYSKSNTNFVALYSISRYWVAIGH